MAGRQLNVNRRGKGDKKKKRLSSILHKTRGNDKSIYLTKFTMLIRNYFLSFLSVLFFDHC